MVIFVVVMKHLLFLLMERVCLVLVYNPKDGRSYPTYHNPNYHNHF